MEGRSLAFYDAPLFLAWQLTNGCTGRCLTCCEESGVGKAWSDELSADEALNVTRQIIDLQIPYVAFGGGEPMGVPHFWDIVERLSAAGIAIKLETNGAFIDNAAAARLHALGVECIQISIDAATGDTHEVLRPGFSFSEALRAIDRLVSLGGAPQWVFVPTRLNVHEMVRAFECAVEHGCSAFVTGPLMRLGRAAGSWPLLACEPAEYAREVAALRQRAAELGSSTVVSVYPWDILTEVQVRLTSPQAMLLVVPNGKVKLLNALPFAPADLRTMSLAEAWNAYRRAWQSPKVAAFIGKCGRNPSLLMHANEVWDMPEVAAGESVAASMPA